MKTTTATLSFLLLLNFWTFAQNEEAKVSKHLVGIYIIPLKASYELGIGTTQTLEFATGVNGSSTFKNDQIKFSLVPMAEASYKYYYNLNQRQMNGKNTAMNSGNFWGLNTRYGFKAISENGDDFGSVFISPMWGIQRNYSSRFSLGLRLGYGIVFTRNDSFLNPFINFKLGFILYNK